VKNEKIKNGTFLHCFYIYFGPRREKEELGGMKQSNHRQTTFCVTGEKKERKMERSFFLVICLKWTIAGIFV
jgi:hypothetical protein